MPTKTKPLILAFERAYATRKRVRYNERLLDTQIVALGSIYLSTEAAAVVGNPETVKVTIESA